MEASTSASPAGSASQPPVDGEMGPLSSAEYVCSYAVHGMNETPRICGRAATKLVVWSPRTEWGTVTYCRMHYQSVDSFLSEADDITDLVPEEC